MKKKEWMQEAKQTRAERARDKAEWILTLVILLLSLLPLGYVAGENRNLLQLFQVLGTAQDGTPFRVYLGMQAVIPVLYGIYLICILRKREANLFSNLLTYYMFLEIIPHIGLLVYFNLDSDTGILGLTAVTLFARWLAVMLEYVNKRSGIEFWEQMLKKK